MYNNIPNQMNYHALNLEYVEEYLKQNIGKDVEVYVSFPDSIEWRDKIFKGKLRYVGKDYLVIDNQVIWCIYINYLLLN